MLSKGPTTTHAEQLDQLGYERNAPPLFGYILRFVGSPSDAEDILQECFLRALTFLAAESERDETHYRRWLYHVATNLCHDTLRRRAVARRHTIPFETDPSSSSSADSPATATEPADPATSFPSLIARQQLIEDVFSRMEAQDVSALLLSDHFGFSLREVAQMLDCSYAAAAKRVGRARIRFTRHYRELGGEKAAR